MLWMIRTLEAPLQIQSPRDEHMAKVHLFKELTGKIRRFITARDCSKQRIASMMLGIKIKTPYAFMKGVNHLTSSRLLKAVTHAAHMLVIQSISRHPLPECVDRLVVEISARPEEISLAWSLVLLTRKKTCSFLARLFQPSRTGNSLAVLLSPLFRLSLHAPQDLSRPKYFAVSANLRVGKSDMTSLFYRHHLLYCSGSPGRTLFVP